MKRVPFTFHRVKKGLMSFNEKDVRGARLAVQFDILGDGKLTRSPRVPEWFSGRFERDLEWADPT